MTIDNYKKSFLALKGRLLPWRIAMPSLKGVSMKSPVEVVFWSIAFPGFGQLLNRSILKGILFIGLEFLINVKANINEAIVLSFNGYILESIQAVNYEWIMFYPCIYSFAIWDAYKDAGGNSSAYSFLPTVLSAYLGTLGVVFSREPIFASLLIGPIWLGLLGMATGASLGFLIKIFITNTRRQALVDQPVTKK